MADIILSAETAALEDGLINALQHRSIRSILGTATNVYCFGVDGGKGNETLRPRALNEQVSWFLLLSCSLHVLSWTPVHLHCSVWFAQCSAGWTRAELQLQKPE